MNYIIVIALIVGLATLLAYVNNLRSTRARASVDASCGSCSTGGGCGCNLDALNASLQQDSAVQLDLKSIRKS
jgi:hypothetical protein